MKMYSEKIYITYVRRENEETANYFVYLSFYLVFDIFNPSRYKIKLSYKKLNKKRNKPHHI